MELKAGARGGNAIGGQTSACLHIHGSRNISNFVRIPHVCAYDQYWILLIISVLILIRILTKYYKFDSTNAANNSSSSNMRPKIKRLPAFREGTRTRERARGGQGQGSHGQWGTSPLPRLRPCPPVVSRFLDFEQKPFSEMVQKARQLRWDVSS